MVGLIQGLSVCMCGFHSGHHWVDAFVLPFSLVPRGSDVLWEFFLADFFCLVMDGHGRMEFSTIVSLRNDIQ